MFSLSRFKDHVLESVMSVGSYYKPVIPTERYDDFTEEELEILKSSIKIETILNDGSEVLAQIDSNGTIYTAYLAKTNDALWLLTLDNEGYNEDFSYQDNESEENVELKVPYLVIELNTQNDKSQRETYYVDVNLTLHERKNAGHVFTPVEETEEIQELLEDKFPTKIEACITEYAFEYLHVGHSAEIVYKKETVEITPEDWSDFAEAFEKDNRETIGEILQGDYYQYFDYSYKNFLSYYEEAYKMTDEENKKVIEEKFGFKSLEELEEALSEDVPEAKELKKMLVRAYTKAQEEADGNACFNHLMNFLVDKLECKKEEGTFIFSHATFAKHALNMKISMNGIDDLFFGDFDFDFKEYYHGTIDKEYFNQELYEILSEK